MDWIYMRHPETEGETRIPNKPNVLKAHEARDWEKAEPPDPRIPAKPRPRSSQEWVVLYHPDVVGSQRIPNKPSALEEARKKGWTEKPPVKAGDAPKKSAQTEKKADFERMTHSG